MHLLSRLNVSSEVRGNKAFCHEFYITAAEFSYKWKHCRGFLDPFLVSETFSHSDESDEAMTCFMFQLFIIHHFKLRHD